MNVSRTGFVLVALVVTLTAGVIGYGVGSRLASREPTSENPWLPGSEGAEPVWLEIPAPDAEFETARGEPVRLADFEGRILLLNFWGSWCPPCLIEIPHLIEVQRALEDLGGTIIAPAVDSGSGEDVLEFAEAQGINYPVWLSDYETAVGRFGAAGYPFTVLIDRDGIIRKRYLGPQTSRTLLRDIAALVSRESRPVGSPDSAQVTGVALSSSSWPR